MIRKPFSLIVLLFFPVLSLLFLVSYPSAQPLSKNGLKKEIMILSRTREKALRDPKQNRNDGDKDQFVSYLDKRIASLCKTLASGFGLSEISGLPCPANVVFVPHGKAQVALSTNEKIKKADTALTRSLGDFDDLLKREQERLKNETIPLGETTGKGSGSEKSAGGLNHDSQTDSGKSAGTTNNGALGSERGSRIGQKGKEHPEQMEKPHENLPGTKIQGVSKPSATAHGPGTLSGDDDIVARQLREAAEMEKDPELKKRLWEEYRKYKEGLQ